MTLVGILPLVSLVLATAAGEDRPGDLARWGFFGARIRPRTADERAKQQIEGGAGVVIEGVLPDSTATTADRGAGIS